MEKGRGFGSALFLCRSVDRCAHPFYPEIVSGTEPLERKKETKMTTLNGNMSPAELKAAVAQMFAERIAEHEAQLERARGVMLGQGYILVLKDDSAFVMMRDGDGYRAKAAPAHLCGAPHVTRDRAEMIVASDARLRAIHVNDWHRERIAELSELLPHTR